MSTAYDIQSFRQVRDLSRLSTFGLDEATLEPSQRTEAEARLTAQMNWHGHEPEQDRWVVYTTAKPAQLIAHAFVRAQTKVRSYGYIAVVPAWQRQGIGSALLAHLRTQAHRKRTQQLVMNAAMDNMVGHAFLCHHNFQVVGHIRSFVAPAAVTYQAPEIPPGFTLRTLAEMKDLALLAAVQNRCYQDMWGHVENTPGEMNEARLKQSMALYPHSFIPEGIFFLFAPTGEAVGLCYGRTGAKTASGVQKIVDSPGVAPEYRHLGLQRPLVLATAQWLRHTYGEGAMTLETYGDFDEAIASYQALGFVLEPKNHWVDYVLPV